MTQHKWCHPLTAKEPWMEVSWHFRDPGSLVVGAREVLGVEKYWVENCLSQALRPQNELSGGAPEKCFSLKLHPLHWEASDWRHSAGNRGWPAAWLAGREDLGGTRGPVYISPGNCQHWLRLLCGTGRASWQVKPCGHLWSGSKDHTQGLGLEPGVLIIM